MPGGVTHFKLIHGEFYSASATSGQLSWYDLHGHGTTATSAVAYTRSANGHLRVFHIEASCSAAGLLTVFVDAGTSGTIDAGERIVQKQLGASGSLSVDFSRPFICPKGAGINISGPSGVLTCSVEAEITG